MKTLSALLFAFVAFVSVSLGQPAPTTKSTFPAAMEAFQIPSHGVGLNALMYIAEGPGPHPVVILLHGFPGNERNLDLAQDMRRAGWNVLYFNYRGSWGTKGDYSFSNSIEDVSSAVAYLKQPETVKSLRLDPKRVVLVGHSMGGFATVQGAANDPSVLAAALISAADYGGAVPSPLAKDAEPAFLKGLAQRLERSGMAPLAGCTSEGLAREVVANASQWKFVARADALRTRPVLVITSDDGLAKMNNAFASALKSAGSNSVTAIHFATDHSYSDKRLELSEAIRNWLLNVVSKPAASESEAHRL